MMAAQEQLDHEERPWGAFIVLSDQPTHKVKRIEVKPGQRLSYQRHQKRCEHWFIVSGNARVVLDGEIHDLTAGHGFDIPAGSWHRIQNAGKQLMTFIEIQTGDYFGEDDIERAEDDYGRTQ